MKKAPRDIINIFFYHTAQNLNEGKKYKMEKFQRELFWTETKEQTWEQSTELKIGGP